MALPSTSHTSWVMPNCWPHRDEDRRRRSTHPLNTRLALKPLWRQQLRQTPRTTALCPRESKVHTPATPARAGRWGAPGQIIKTQTMPRPSGRWGRSTGPQGGNPGRDARTSGPGFRQPGQQYSPAIRTRTRTTGLADHEPLPASQCATSSPPAGSACSPQPQVTRQASRLGGARKSKRGFEAALCEAAS